MSDSAPHQPSRAELANAPARRARMPISSLTTRPAGVPRFLRQRSGRTVGGVAGGLAQHFGVSVLWVRVTFVVLTACAGAGVVAYALLWILAPQEPLGEPTHSTSQRERQQALALIALGVAITATISALSGLVSAWILLPLAAAVAGAAVVWREADTSQRRRWTASARGATLLRVMAGATLVCIGVGVVLLRNVDLHQVQVALLAVLATLIGVAVLTVPWWLRLVRDLGDERWKRVRTEERAEVAAHLHDSVLQTLALIQKQSDTPREVLRLARSQERQLRAWLYGPNGYGHPQFGESDIPATLTEAITQASGEVEDTFAVAVRPVIVGDCPLNDQLVALTQATREAMVNAAKHSGQNEISVYVEVEPERVEVFIRDRGKGFDTAAIPTDRHGIVDSIRARMDRHGGTVVLRSALGEGTEVRLAMSRNPTSPTKESS